MKGKKVALLGLLTALSVISFLIENLFPPILIPGAKLGLGNIFVMLCLIYLGLPSGIILVVSKCLISAIFGGFSALLYSLPAGLFSLFLGYILLKFSKKISIVAISAVLGTAHNLVQNVVFCFVVNSVKVLLYAPYLAFLGVICGVFTGLVTYLLLNKFSTLIINKFEINYCEGDKSGYF